MSVIPAPPVIGNPLDPDRVIVPDFFPADWTEEGFGPNGALILRQYHTERVHRRFWFDKQKNWFEEVVIPFRLNGQWPTRPGAPTAWTCFEHRWSHAFRIDEWLIDGPGPWKMKPGIDQSALAGMRFANGDNIAITLTLTYDGVAPYIG